MLRRFVAPLIKARHTIAKPSRLESISYETNEGKGTMLQVDIAKAAYVFWKYSNLLEKHKKQAEELLELRRKNKETPSYQVISDDDEGENSSNSCASKRQKTHTSQFLFVHSQ